MDVFNYTLIVLHLNYKNINLNYKCMKNITFHYLFSTIDELKIDNVLDTMVRKLQ